MKIPTYSVPILGVLGDLIPLKEVTSSMGLGPQVVCLTSESLSVPGKPKSWESQKKRLPHGDL